MKFTFISLQLCFSFWLLAFSLGQAQSYQLVAPDGYSDYKWYKVDGGGNKSPLQNSENTFIVDEKGIYFGTYEGTECGKGVTEYFMITGSCTPDDIAIINLGAIDETVSWSANGITLPDQNSSKLEIVASTEPILYSASPIDKSSDTKPSPGFIVVKLGACSEDLVEMRTGFSPNGDGINDQLIIEGIDINLDNALTIYNRWGAKVWETMSYKNDWSGEWEDQTSILPSGTYFYALSVAGEEAIRSGYIQIMR